MDGLIGIDVASARAEILQFAELGKKGYRQLFDCARYFFDDLSTKWASPNAVAFYDEYADLYYNVVCDFERKLMHKVHGANDAGRTLSRAHGESWVDVEYSVDSPGDYHYSFLKESIDGVSGMAVENVKTICYSFRAAIQNAVASVYYLPTSIQFVSPDGSLVSEYAINIKSIVDEMGETLDPLSSAIWTYIETETDNILLAKNEAENILKSNA